MKFKINIVLIQMCLVGCTNGGYKALSISASKLTTSLSSSSTSTPTPIPSPTPSPVATVVQPVTQFFAQSLTAGQSIQDGNLQLSMQSDGNLVLYQSGSVVWNSQSWGRHCSSGCVAQLGNDGNITLTQNGKVYFQTVTGGHSNVSFKLQAQSPHIVITSDQGLSSTATDTSCQLTLNSCPLHPEISNQTMLDTAENSANDQKACAAQAQYYYQYCGGSISMVGQTISSTFYSNNVASLNTSAGGQLADLQPTTSLALTARATTNDYGFTQYIFAFPIPANVTGAVGFHGDIRAGVANGQQGDGAYDLLATVGYSPKACGLNGKSYKGSYDPVFSDLGVTAQNVDEKILSTFIIKGVYNDQIIQNVNFPLPAALPINGCLFVILDGGFIGSAPLHMESNLTLDLITQGLATATQIAPGDEFCTGVPTGTPCGMLNSTNRSGDFLFARSVEIKTSGTLLALYGSISQGSLPEPLPSQPWGVTHNYYIDRSCAHLPENVYSSANLKQQASQMIPLAQFQFSDPSGTQSALQSMIYQPLFTSVNAGDCLVHFLSVQSDSAALSTETQIHGLIQPGIVNSLALNPGYSKQGIFRFFNNLNGDHLLSLLNNEIGNSTVWNIENNAQSVFNVLSGTGIPTALPLFRCAINDSGLHFATTDSGCEGQHYESTFGSIYSRPKNNTSPLYRFFNTSNGQHLVTSNINDGLSSGAQIESILGFVPN